MDIGCGRGGGIAMLAKNYGAKECYGLDISSHQINYASTRYDDVENLHYITGDAEKLI